MKQQKIYSIIIGLVAYIIISHIFHVFFRGKTDIALSLLYIYNDMLYIVGYIFTFMVYGSNKFNRILFGTLSIAFLLFFLFDSVCPHIFRRITCFTHPHFVFPLGIRVGDLPYGIWPIWDSFDLNHKITIARFALCFPLYRNSQYYLFPL